MSLRWVNKQALKVLLYIKYNTLQQKLETI